MLKVFPVGERSFAPKKFNAYMEYRDKTLVSSSQLRVVVMEAFFHGKLRESGENENMSVLEEKTLIKTELLPNAHKTTPQFGKPLDEHEKWLLEWSLNTFKGGIA